MMMMTFYPKRIFIDLETFSSTDLSKCGVYKYAESEDFEILCEWHNKMERFRQIKMDSFLTQASG